MEYKEEKKNCQNCKKDFTIEPDDFSFYEKMKVPAPTFCPECRMQRRLSWKNDFNLYSRNCYLCEKNFISIYSIDKPYKVICAKCFWGDKWNPASYGIEYDFSKSFFQQFYELMLSVPMLGNVTDNGVGSINCDYVQDVNFSKNCYMTFITWKAENFFYCVMCNTGRDLIDCLGVHDFSELTYDSLIIDHTYMCRNVYWSSSLTDCQYVWDCRGCSDCFMCYGLRNQQFCFQNKRYSKEEYKKILLNYKLDTRSGNNKVKTEFMEYIKKFPHKYANLVNCFNCNGDDMIHSKNTHNSFFASLSENSRFVSNGIGFKDSYDCSGGGETTLSYECITPDLSYNSLFTIFSWNGNEISYCRDCHSSQNIFGCVSLKHGEYSILNKKYSKQEYFDLKKKIIEQMKENGEWGQFFPIKFSPFGYNESRAQEIFKISDSETKKLGYNWNKNFQKTTGQETINQNDIPDNIDQVNDNIVQEVLSCINCNRNYKIVEGELVLYRKMKIPIPEKCFFCRHEEREKIRRPQKLWHRKCMKEGCNNEFETSYAPERPEIVYCDKCYQQEVY